MPVTTINPPTDPGSLARLRDAVSRTAPSAQIRKALIGVVDALAQGSPVRVEPVAQMVTTSQAAQMLNVSRTTLVKLLDDRKIPYEQPNVHRLVAVADVLAYREKHSSV